MIRYGITRPQWVNTFLYHENGLLAQHWNGNVILKTFLSLAALKVVKMTTFSVASDENVIKITTFPCQWGDSVIIFEDIEGCHIANHATCQRWQVRPIYFSAPLPLIHGIWQNWYVRQTNVVKIYVIPSITSSRVPWKLMDVTGHGWHAPEVNYWGALVQTAPDCICDWSIRSHTSSYIAKLTCKQVSMDK